MQLLQDALACGEISRPCRPGVVNVLQEKADDPALLGETAQEPGGNVRTLDPPIDCRLSLEIGHLPGKLGELCHHGAIEERMRHDVDVWRRRCSLRSSRWSMHVSCQRTRTSKHQHLLHLSITCFAYSRTPLCTSAFVDNTPPPTFSLPISQPRRDYCAPCIIPLKPTARRRYVTMPTRYRDAWIQYRATTPCHVVLPLACTQLPGPPHYSGS